MTTSLLPSPPAGAPGEPARRARPSKDGIRRFARNRVGLISAIVLALFLLAILLGPFFTPDPNAVDTAARLQSPGYQHLFGTDHLGRDLLARVLVGGRISLLVAIASTIAGILVALVIGTLAGYIGGPLDGVLARIFDVLATFPNLLIGIVVAAVLGGSITSVIIALSIAQVALFGRLFRVGTLTVSQREYVRSAVALGIPHTVIVIRNILPNVIVPVMVVATGNIGRLAVTEGSLSYLGAGIQPPTASWGNMIADGQPYLQVAAWYPIVPGVFLVLVTIAFSFIGDALRDAFDVREAVAKGTPTGVKS
jgi:peptide/nickel transport system permease protein